MHVESDQLCGRSPLVGLCNVRFVMASCHHQLYACALAIVTSIVNEPSFYGCDSAVESPLHCSCFVAPLP